jgi:hypothetical protein
MRASLRKKPAKKGKPRKATSVDRMNRRKGTSDDDTGYLWGKKGRAKAEKQLSDSKKKSGYLWKDHKPK